MIIIIIVIILITIAVIMNDGDCAHSWKSTTEPRRFSKLSHKASSANAETNFWDSLVARVFLNRCLSAIIFRQVLSKYLQQRYIQHPVKDLRWRILPNSWWLKFISNFRNNVQLGCLTGLWILLCPISFFQICAITFNQTLTRTPSQNEIWGASCRRWTVQLEISI